MKRISRRSFLKTAGVMASLAALSACGDDSSSVATSTNTATSTSSEAASELADGLASAEPITATIHMHYWDYIVFDDSWKVFEKAAEVTNVSLKGTASASATSSTEVFNQMIASSNIPDIVCSTIGTLTQYANEGAFLPIGDLIAEHAPHYQAFLDENPDFAKSLTNADGEMYIIPYYESNPHGEIWTIRKDWLDACGLGIPTTVDEYHDTLQEFVEKDVNGQNNVIGYFDRDNGSGTRNLLMLWGVPEGWMIRDGAMVHGQNDPNLKTALIEIAKWYDEGLIDLEIFTRGNNARDTLFGENIGASTHDWAPSTLNYNIALAESVEGFDLVPMLPPNAQLGKSWDYSTGSSLSTYGQGCAISANTEYPVEMIKYLDFWWTEEGARLANYGVEGEEYEMVDGEVKYLDSFLTSGDEAVINKLHAVGAQIAFAYKMDYNYTLMDSHEYLTDAASMYEDVAMDPLPMLSFTEEEQAVLDSKVTALDTYYLEQVQTWILTNGDIEGEFDAYLAKMDELGLQDVIDAYNSAYARFSSN